jgi:hypothetical protein
VSHTRPDISFAASRLAQATSTLFDPETIKFSNKVIKHLKAHPELALRYRKLNKKALRILAYSDSSLHNNGDHFRNSATLSYWPIRPVPAVSFCSDRFSLKELQDLV